MRMIDADALIARLEEDAEQMEDPIAIMFTHGAINDIKHEPTAQPDTDCNTCLRQACKYRDGTIRVNCPLWRGSAV